MAQEKPSRLAELVLIIRTQTPVLKQRFADWIADCREEPRLIWETTAVRYISYGVVGILLAWLVSGLIELVAPVPQAAVKPPAETADYHVLCTNPECGEHFVINRPFGFDDFPITCPKCKKETGRRAVRCVSEMCGGRWVVPTEADDRLYCPHCAQPFPE